MARLILAAVIALLSLPALAQTAVTPPPGVEDMPPPPPGGVAVSKDGRMVMSSDLCPSLAAGEPAVPGADYTPGVDVEGRPVAPADLPGSASPLGAGDVPIAIRPDLAKRYGAPANSSFFHGKAMTGVITVQNGRAYLNGVPLAANEQSMLAAACRDAKQR
ncbi:MAG TPA: hypothetical protein VE397_02260 [Stellaceae bacterium]|jgi:hypothetical protein|nr:hypothetical protein [Stellaceae bacterium]